MSDPRMNGLMLMAVATAAFLGTTSNSLPSATFFPALALFGLGAIKFLKSNHEALERADERVDQAVNPRLRENRHAQAHAQRQARRQGTALSRSGPDKNANAIASEDLDQIARGEFIEFDDQDIDLVVATDVSFPVEIQSGDALADPLRKLNQLLEPGVLTEEEYAVAKAKLLS
jgi:hypothetical protein